MLSIRYMLIMQYSVILLPKYTVVFSYPLVTVLFMAAVKCSQGLGVCLVCWLNYLLVVTQRSLLGIQVFFAKLSKFSAW